MKFVGLCTIEVDSDKQKGQNECLEPKLGKCMLPAHDNAFLSWLSSMHLQCTANRFVLRALKKCLNVFSYFPTQCTSAHSNLYGVT